MMPVMLCVKDKLCTVIGGGNAAYRKAKTLIGNGARVRVISRELSEKFRDMDVEYIQKEYSDGDIKDSFLVIAATDNPELNRKIGKDVRRRKGANLFLSSDNKDNSDLMFSAYTEFGDIKIAVSTGGGYPMLGAAICRRLEGECKKYNEINKILSDYRKRILDSRLDAEQKRGLMEKLVSDEMLDIGDTEEFRNEAERIMEQWI